MTVWTLTPNPALDFTYRIPELNIGIPHRVEDIDVRPGGKGLNVSRVLAQLGRPSVATGFLGGANGQRLAGLLSAVPESDLIDQRFVEFDGQTRMSIAVVDDKAEATVLNEAGEAPSDQAWSALIAKLRAEVKEGDLVATCGSFPGKSSPDWMTKIVEAVHEVGARILVDATGENLVRACQAGADLVKPNDLELFATTGKDNVCAGANELLKLGVKVVITSEGEEGMTIHAEDGAFCAKPAQVVAGNPTGAGDASVAAWCAYISELDEKVPGSAPAELTAENLKGGLPMAVALSGAAVAKPVAGEVDLDLYKEMLDQIKVEATKCH